MAVWPLSDFQVASTSAVNTATSVTTTVTSSATANVKGSYVELFTALPYEAHGLVLHIIGPSLSASDDSVVVDLAIGAAGAELIVVPDLLIGAQSSGGGQHFTLPLRLPAGARVAIRSAAAVASKSMPVQLFAYAGGIVPGESTAVAQSLGVGTVSGGTVLSTPSATHTKGAWTELGVTARPSRFLLFSPNKPAGTADTAADTLVDVGIGPAGAEVVVLANTRVGIHASEQIRSAPILIPCSLPASTRIAARHQGSAITAASIPRAAVMIFG